MQSRLRMGAATNDESSNVQKGVGVDYDVSPVGVINGPLPKSHNMHSFNGSTHLPYKLTKPPLPHYVALHLPPTFCL